MKLYAIGDIHGCAVELREMLGRIDEVLKPEDTLICLGDYIDRGPHSKQVVDLLLRHREISPAKHVFLRGNHEDMMLDAYNSSARDLFGWGLMPALGMATVRSYGADPASFKLSEEHLKFFNSLLPYYQHGRYVFAHAGINPGKSLSEQSMNDLIWERKYVGYNGDYQDNHCVIYGHTPKSKPVVGRNQYGIDTACVFGHFLTCIVIDPQYEGVEFYHVKAKKEYS